MNKFLRALWMGVLVSGSLEQVSFAGKEEPECKDGADPVCMEQDSSVGSGDELGASHASTQDQSTQTEWEHLADSRNQNRLFQNYECWAEQLGDLEQPYLRMGPRGFTLSISPQDQRTVYFSLDEVSYGADTDSMRVQGNFHSTQLTIPFQPHLNWTEGTITVQIVNKKNRLVFWKDSHQWEGTLSLSLKAPSGSLIDLQNVRLKCKSFSIRL